MKEWFRKILKAGNRTSDLVCDLVCSIDGRNNRVEKCWVSIEIVLGVLLMVEIIE
jgi:hypothetical protein